jgi:hypothetical protein
MCVRGQLEGTTVTLFLHVSAYLKFNRNGGHINPPLWADWKERKERHGTENARLLVKFRLAHVQEMQAIASKEDILKESQVRVTEHLEVYMTQEGLDEAKEELKGWTADMPDIAKEYVAYSGEEARQVQ